MKTKLALSAVVAAIAVFSQSAFAQASMPTRAEVKAEAKTGALAPAGEGPGAMAGEKNTTGKSTKSRMMRKDETKAAAKAGELAKPGEGPGAMAKMPSTMSDKTRAERKAQTKADIKAGETKPAGEAALPLAVPAKK